MKLLVTIDEEVMSYIRFYAPDDATAMAEAEKLWDDGVADMNWDVADIWKVRLTVSSEDGTYERCCEDDINHRILGVIPVIDRRGADDDKLYYARYLGDRSVATSYDWDCREASFDGIGDAINKMYEDYQTGKFHKDIFSKVCIYNPMVEVFRDDDVTVEGFVGDQNLSDIC